MDTSFELPIDTRDDGVNGGPIPLGDEGRNVIVHSRIRGSFGRREPVEVIEIVIRLHRSLIRSLNRLRRCRQGASAARFRLRSTTPPTPTRPPCRTTTASIPRRRPTGRGAPRSSSSGPRPQTEDPNRGKQVGSHVTNYYVFI